MDGALKTADPACPGVLLGSYELVRLLGEGSMGRVYEARHVKLSRPVALKVLREEHTRDRRVTERFFREARTVNQINHEHIVEVMDFVEAESDPTGHAYCVMELLNGRTLAQAMAQERFGVQRSVRLIRQICGALQAAHQVGVVHRDLKPDNVFLTERGGESDYVKVLDFGVAKLLAGADPNTGQTVDGVIVGTPQYMSPEQAASLDVDHRADIYAVGALLYELLAGRPPFADAPFGHLLVQVITEPPPTLGTATGSGEQLPNGLVQVVMRCLEKDPERRPQTMLELDALLAPYADSASLRRIGRIERGVRWVAGSGLALALTAIVVFTPWEQLAAAARAKAATTPDEVSLEVTSTPAGAQVVRTDTGAMLGVTPMKLSLRRTHGELPLRVSLNGHRQVDKRVRVDMDASVDVELPLVVPASGQTDRKTRTTRDAVVDPFHRN